MLPLPKEFHSLATKTLLFIFGPLFATPTGLARNCVNTSASRFPLTRLRKFKKTTGVFRIHWHSPIANKHSPVTAIKTNARSLVCLVCCCRSKNTITFSPYPHFHPTFHHTPSPSDLAGYGSRRNS